MRILCVTDLHGIEWKYDRLFYVVVDGDVDAVVNGGDMLPAANIMVMESVGASFYH